MRLWWNGIHNGLKIRRGNLAGSNPANRTKNESPLAGDFVLAYDKGDLLGDEVFFREK